MSIVFQSGFNLGGLFLVVMASTVFFELSQISCEIYINTFTSVYDISLKNVPPTPMQIGVLQ